MQKIQHGVIDQSASNRKTDYLYRVSVKALIRDSEGKVLVVKEDGKSWWDLPGGGMDHGDDIGPAIKRELQEEIGLSSEFQYRIIAVEDPAHLEFAGLLQVRIIFEVVPELLPSEQGTDADAMEYIDPDVFKDSKNPIEKKIYEYATLNPGMFISS